MTVGVRIVFCFSRVCVISESCVLSLFDWEERYAAAARPTPATIKRMTIITGARDRDFGGRAASGGVSAGLTGSGWSAGCEVNEGDCFSIILSLAAASFSCSSTKMVDICCEGISSGVSSKVGN